MKENYNSFFKVFIENLIVNSNNYFLDNYAEYRYGKKSIKIKIAERVYKFFYKLSYKGFKTTFYQKDILNLLYELESFYKLLNDEKSKNLLINVISFRLLGYKKIKIHLKKINNIKVNVISKNSTTVEFLNRKIKFYKQNFNFNGESITIFYHKNGLKQTFMLEQYKYKHDSILIEAESGDYVIDAGGCYGDTALYFAAKVGEKGKVFSFEFVPSNINILKENLSLNPTFKNRIEVIENPLWLESNKSVYVLDKGPGSQIKFEEKNEYSCVVKTLSIDDFVKNKEIAKIDFIKMDIEGAELNVLKGAVNTLKNYKPKLAISLYHNIQDFIEIPKYINELNLGYRFYLGHYTIHQEETILFAKV